jgi:16S rRNA processing protein RimM
MDRFVCIGEVVKAIGLKGELKLYPLLDYYPPVLESPYLVWRDGSPVMVRKHRPAGSCVAVTVEGIGDRNAAEAAVGRELGFRRDSYACPDFPRPEEGLPFRYLDRPVETVDGQKLGTVAEVRLAGARYLLVIPSDKGEILIPSVEPILRFDDELEGVLVVDPPEGLLDVQSG